MKDLACADNDHQRTLYAKPIEAPTDTLSRFVSLFMNMPCIEIMQNTETNRRREIGVQQGMKSGRLPADKPLMNCKFREFCFAHGLTSVCLRRFVEDSCLRCATRHERRLCSARRNLSASSRPGPPRLVASLCAACPASPIMWPRLTFDMFPDMPCMKRAYRDK